MVGFSKINGLLHHGISRKELLRYVAIATLGLLGIAAVLQGLGGTASSSTSNNDFKGSGYSSSVYGR